MRYRFGKYFWVGCNFILLICILFASGVVYYSEEDNKFCVLSISCDEGEIEVKEERGWNKTTYKGRKEGIVEEKFPYHKSFFKTVRKVISVSEEEYSEVIKEISMEGTFNEIYDKYSDIFDEEYSLEIDSYFSRDYIQNIGELISNDYSGDCDDYAMWLYLIAKEKGLDVRYVIGFREGGGHAWVQVKINNEWVDYNSVFNNVGVDVVSKKYLNIYYYGDDDG